MKITLFEIKCVINYVALVDTFNNKTSKFHLSVHGYSYEWCFKNNSLCGSCLHEQHKPYMEAL